jgi:hypothetical protein
MIIAYVNHSSIEKHIIDADNQSLLAEAIWIDMLSPDKAEEKMVEQYTKLNVPAGFIKTVALYS